MPDDTICADCQGTGKLSESLTPHTGIQAGLCPRCQGSGRTGATPRTSYSLGMSLSNRAQTSDESPELGHIRVSATDRIIFVGAALTGLVPVLMVPLAYADGFMLGTTVLLISIAIAAGTWRLARHQRGAFAQNGFGTKFYQSEHRELGLVATKWLTFLGVPLLPIQSFRVWEIKERKLAPLGYSQSMNLEPLAESGFYWKHVAKLMVPVWLLAALLALWVHHIEIARLSRERENRPIQLK